jgi:hypothetical protein
VAVLPFVDFHADIGYIRPAFGTPLVSAQSEAPEKLKHILKEAELSLHV